MTDFTANISLFPTTEKKSEKSPDASGNIEILESEIQAVISYLQTAERTANYKDEQVVKIRVATWNNESKAGKRYLAGKVSPPMAQSDTATQPSASSELPF